MTKAQLIEYGENMGITGLSLSMTKAAIIEAIENSL
jgi:hypothetical protein